MLQATVVKRGNESVNYFEEMQEKVFLCDNQFLRNQLINVIIVLIAQIIKLLINPFEFIYYAVTKELKPQSLIL
jgi:hypothetical protein